MKCTVAIKFEALFEGTVEAENEEAAVAKVKQLAADVQHQIEAPDGLDLCMTNARIAVQETDVKVQRSNLI